MMIITPDTNARQADEALSAVLEDLGKLRRELRAATALIETGGDTEVTEVKRQLASLKALTELSMKLEVQVGEHKQKRSQIAQGGYALDLDAARAEIGCRLDRIRVVKCPEEISG